MEVCPGRGGLEAGGTALLLSSSADRAVRAQGREESEQLTLSSTSFPKFRGS